MEGITFKAFLSHSYGAVDVNLYFFNLFKDIANVQFEVDKKFEAKEGEPKKKSSTNVTRLERMLRDADAFIGLYPFAGVPEGSNLIDELKKQSRYFRLEMDLAVRSQKPAIVFYDKRYGDLLKPPDSVFSHPFDANEISSKAASPNVEKIKNTFTAFCRQVQRKKAFDDNMWTAEKNAVALALSKESGNEDFIEKIRGKLEEYNCSDVELIKSPACLGNKIFRLLEKVDFAIVDHGGGTGESGLAAYLHGRFVPMIRTLKAAPEGVSNKLTALLYDGAEVGYKKDALVWETEDVFLTELTDRLDAILKKDVERFNTYEEAENYFMRATLREDKVFVSYSGKDLDAGKDIIKGLKGYFKTVFDYRDGKSIEPGQSWQNEIFTKLNESKIGICLLSAGYFESGNCVHEAQQMTALRDNKLMKVYPVKLYADALAPNAFLESTQYLRKADFSDVDGLVKEIVRLSGS